MNLKNLTNVARIDEIELKKFGIIFSILLVCIFGFFVPWLFNKSIPLLPFLIATLITIVAFTKSALIWFLYKPWMIFGAIMGFLNTKIILSIAFFLVIWPTTMIVKLLRKDFLNLSNDQNSSSYWKTVDKEESTNLKDIY